MFSGEQCFIVHASNLFGRRDCQKSVKWRLGLADTDRTSVKHIRSHLRNVSFGGAARTPQAHAELKRRSSNLTVPAAVEFLCFWSFKSTTFKNKKTCLLDGLTWRRALQTLQLYVAELLPIITASQTDLVIGQLPFSFHATSPSCSPSRLIPKNKPLTTKLFQKTLPCQARGQRAHFVARKQRLNTCPDRCRGDEKWQESQSMSKRISFHVYLRPVTSSAPNSPTAPCQPRQTRTTLRQPAVSPSSPAQIFHCFYYPSDQHVVAPH